MDGLEPSTLYAPLGEPAHRTGLKSRAARLPTLRKSRQEATLNIIDERQPRSAHLNAVDKPEGFRPLNRQTFPSVRAGQ